MTIDGLEGKEAARGEKMIEIKVRLWTNDIADEKGKIVPKHAWDAGVVRLEASSTHGIRAHSPVPFNGVAELLGKIEELLIAHGVKLHLSPRARKYLIADA